MRGAWGPPAPDEAVMTRRKPFFVPSDRFYVCVDPSFVLGGAAELRSARRELHDLQRDDQRRPSRPEIPDRDGLPIPLRLKASVLVF